MNSGGQSKDITDHKDVPFIPRFIGTLRPVKNQPRHHRRRQRTHGIRLRLHCVKPVTVCKRKYEGADGPRAVNYPSIFALLGLPTEQCDKLNNNEIEKHDRQGAHQGRYDVDAVRDITADGDHRKDSADDQEEGTPRRMGYAKDVGGGNELAAVPVGDRFGHGAEIDKERDSKDAAG